jgi:hypothetical protein
MRQAELGRRLRAEFLRDPGRPPDSGTQTGTGGDLDIRRWEGRLAGACLKQYQKIKADCCGFYAASKRIEAMELTGSPGEEQLSRCALAIYNCGSKLISHVYDIINNPNYIIGKEFPYQLCYDWLRRYTSLLECGDNTGFKIRYQADAMNNVKTAEKRDEDLENCDVYDAHGVNTFASKNQNDENGVMEHTLQNENDEQSRAQEAVATEFVTVSEQIRLEGRKKAQNSKKSRFA